MKREKSIKVAIKYVLLISTLLLLVSCTSANKEQDLKDYKFVYPDSQLMYWLVEEQSIEEGFESVMSTIIDDYIVDGDLKISLLKYELKDNTIELDFSETFNDSIIRDTARHANIGIITNTLCANFDEIKYVKFIIEGEELEVLGDSISKIIYEPKFELTKYN